jgi:hypothetical protein
MDILVMFKCTRGEIQGCNFVECVDRKIKI